MPECTDTAQRGYALRSSLRVAIGHGSTIFGYCTYHRFQGHPSFAPEMDLVRTSVVFLAALLLGALGHDALTRVGPVTHGTIRSEASSAKVLSATDHAGSASDPCVTDIPDEALLIEIPVFDDEDKLRRKFLVKGRVGRNFSAPSHAFFGGAPCSWSGLRGYFPIAQAAAVPRVAPDLCVLHGVFRL